VKFPRATHPVLVFEDRRDCERVYRVIDKRMSKYGLTLHPTKTRVVDFRVMAGPDQTAGGHGNDTFDFLGFTHYWRRSRRGRWVVGRKTAARRLARSLKKVHQYCRRHRHLSLLRQHRYLCRMLRGHYGYYGIVGNFRSIANFAYQVRRIWRMWLRRRDGLRRLTWEKFNVMLERLALPRPRIVHSFGYSP